ncbi:hypothetical protein GCM10017786_65320 [Amycolatopsis deserti]|uniref:Aminoglycoside phosphotransferase n=1 Tax=Amycolatopsis deserti TaxID=185696 RepID=A0ABQ3JCU1_9PSEU|nr:hypothetical protein [Amycolatopsis deserti]GHF22045.1 hypothetical protein GCM10017786_65320 [Amycolatopsis deserti]
MPFRPSSPSTAAVYRVVENGRVAFVKVLQAPRHSPVFAALPGHLRDRLTREFPWRAEADFLLSGFELPPALRTPDVYRIDELGDGRVAMWLEDVQCADLPWDPPRFQHAAYLLGRWAGRRFGGPPGPALRILTEGRLQLDAFTRLTTNDQRTLAGRVPALLDRLDALPQATGHSDACPQNLLIPRAAPDTFVVIDVGWQCPFPVGADLGQLLIGLADEGTLPVTALPALHELVIDAYRDGLRTEGHQVSRDEITFGCDATLAIRSAFHTPPELSAYLTRLGLAL